MDKGSNASTPQRSSAVFGWADRSKLRNSFSLLLILLALAYSGNLVRAASQLWQFSRIRRQSRLARVVKAMAKVWPPYRAVSAQNIQALK